MKSRSIVVCRFNEDISWVNKLKDLYDIVILQKYNSKIIAGNSGTKKHKNFQNLLFSEIIDKGKLQEFLNEVPDGLYPNIGMESHAFFSYVVKNYNKLSDIIIFCQGNPFDHCENFIDIASLCITDNMKFFDIGRIVESDDFGMPTEKNIPVGKIYEELFEKKSPGKFYFTAGSMFMTTKENIYKHPIDFYKKCIEISLRELYAPWIFERLYKTIFYEVND
jgi:hypothetical protein